MLHEGPWYGGLAPTGYKLMRRVPHSERAPPWGQLNKRHRNVNGTGKRGIKRNAVSLQCNSPGTIVAWHARSPSTPRAFRRDPSGFGGVTARRGQAKGTAVPINAELRSDEPA
jgi:hypothetical protein